MRNKNSHYFGIIGKWLSGWRNQNKKKYRKHKGQTLHHSKWKLMGINGSLCSDLNVPTIPFVIVIFIFAVEFIPLDYIWSISLFWLCCLFSSAFFCSFCFRVSCKIIVLCMILLSIARPNRSIRHKKKTREWKKNAIKIDEIDWGWGEWLQQTMYTMVFNAQRQWNFCAFRDS